jgi:four helix bundle protein
MKSYKDLTAYQKAYDLALRVYKATKNYPREEIYGLVSQLRRSAVSLPCNIAEGYRRRSRKEYIQFLHIALGSCSELEILLVLSRDLRFLDESEAKELYSLQEESSRLLYGLIASLTRKP